MATAYKKTEGMRIYAVDVGQGGRPSVYWKYIGPAPNAQAAARKAVDRSKREGATRPQVIKLELLGTCDW